MPRKPENMTIIERIQRLERLQDEYLRDQRLRLTVVADGPIVFDGTTGDVYIVYNDASSRLEFYIGGSLVGYLDATNTGTKLQNT